MSDIYILGIESSCDDTSAAVLKDGVLLSNVTASQAVHEAYGGVVPELASRAHQQNVVPVVDQAVKKAGIDAGCREDIPEDMVNQVIMKELKTVKEQVDSCPDDRAELKSEYEFRMKVIEEFAPKMMSEDEIKAFINEKFADVVATGALPFAATSIL